MMCFEISVSSGMSCRAWRSDAEASANSWSRSNFSPTVRSLSRISGVGVLEAWSGLMCATCLRCGFVGMPSASRMPEKRLSACTPKASRIEPATILSLLLSMVENATSITKKLIIRPMRSAKVTNQPCPPPCASPRFFLAIAQGLPISASAASSSRHRLALFVTVLLRQVGRQHLADQRRALGIPDHQNAVDDQSAIGLLVEQLAVQFVGDRQAKQVRDQRAIERCEQRGRHEG